MWLPIIIVPKKDGTWKMCIDYKVLNKIMLKNIYPLPRIDNLLDQLQQAEYVTNLELKSGYHQVLETLKKHQLLPNIKKCESAQHSLVYLGYVIGGGELKIDPSNMDVIKKWLAPTNFIEVMSFIGGSQYLRKFISSFLAVAALLHAITESGKSFQWGKGQQKDFDELKNKINEAPILTLPNLKRPFEVETDVSGYAMGVILM
eukprot:PITA_33077